MARAIASWALLVGAVLCLLASVVAFTQLQWVLGSTAAVLFIFGVEVSCEPAEY